jgi:DNA-binding response OmpR family regulator
VSLILKNAGFTVLSASSPEEAMQISLDFAGTIHLLLTDVMMPRMSGPDLAKKLVKERTGLRVMMMTGYTGESQSRHRSFRIQGSRARGR